MSRNALALTTLRQFQSETDAIRESGDPIFARSAVWVLATLVAISVALSFVLTLDRVVTSTAGRMVSTEGVTVHQPLETAIIKSIDVKVGQEVEKGQLLATLDQTFAAADVDQLKKQIASLDAQITRAEAEIAGKVPNFAALTDPDHVRYAALQQALYLQRNSQYSAQVVSYDAKISQLEATIKRLQADAARYAEREKISEQIEGMRQTLLEKQAGSLLNLLSANDARLELLRAIDNGRNSLIESRHSLAATIADRDAFRQQWLATTTQELVTARNERDNAVGRYAKAAKHQDLVRLVALEPSVVLTVAKLSIGSVLKPGDPFITLMPLRTPVQAEIQIASRDVGFVRPGDPVTLKIEAFDFLEHGTAEGRLQWVSEDAFTTDDSGKPVDPFYRARVSIETNRLTNVPASFRFIPGMTLTADIHVGERSVARYLLGGLMRGYSEAMRER